MENQTKYQQFFSTVGAQDISVIGVGVSNTPLIDLFLRHGARVTICDRRSRPQLLEALGDNGADFLARGAQLSTGDSYLDHLLQADMVVRAPGVNYYLPQLQAAREAGIPVTSEMELFCDLCPCKLIAITGSDGKTTTTTIIAKLLEKQGHTVHMGGNIGRALLPVVPQMQPQDFAVVELSSFQLTSMRPSPFISVITNITPNHLDVHKDMQEYIDAKKNVLLHQNAFSRTVLGADNQLTAAMQGLVRGQCLLFSSTTPPKDGAFIANDGFLYMTYKGDTTKLLHKDDIKIPGAHNVQNYLAAISATWGYVTPANTNAVAKEFGGVEHRIELVRQLDGVRYYNDSIATSPTRTIAGLDSFPQKIIIIAGGYDKKIPFLPLAPKILEKVKLLILTGQTADKIEECVRSFDGFAQSGLVILRAQDLPDALLKAKAHAKNGDIVSLSPACASFDAYPNFEARGHHFKQLVNAL